MGEGGGKWERKNKVRAGKECRKRKKREGGGVEIQI